MNLTEEDRREVRRVEATHDRVKGTLIDSTLDAGIAKAHLSGVHAVPAHLLKTLALLSPERIVSHRSSRVVHVGNHGGRVVHVSDVLESVIV